MVVSEVRPELSSSANARLIGVIGALVSMACVWLAGAVFLLLPAAVVVAASLATVMTRVPSKFVLGVTTRVYLVLLLMPVSVIAVKVPFSLAVLLGVAPSCTVMSLMVKPVTGASKVKVKVMVSPIVTVFVLLVVMVRGMPRPGVVALSSSISVVLLVPSVMVA